MGKWWDDLKDRAREEQEKQETARQEKKAEEKARATARDTARASAPRWEYKVLDRLRSDLEKQLNKLGAEGWELVAIDALPNTFINLTNKHNPVSRYVFKRPVG